MNEKFWRAQKIGHMCTYFEDKIFKKALLGIHIWLYIMTRWSLDELRTSHFLWLKELNEHKKNDASHDLELETIFHALKMHRHYFLGNIFVFMSDHGGMRYCLSSQGKF